MSKQNKNDEFLSVLGQKYNKEFFINIDKNLKEKLDKTGILILRDFVSAESILELQKEASLLKKRAYRAKSVYNIYVKPEDKSFSPNSPRNRKFKTTKGIIADDQIPKKSILRKIYDADLFRGFMCKTQRLINIYSYSDNLSSINYNYYDSNDSLEWHFDNADFVITLLVKNCEKGGTYEYFPSIRYDKNGGENYKVLEKILDGEIKPKKEQMKAGDLMIFQGNESLHKVTKIEKGERILVTLNYNLNPKIPLSEKSRKTFFGRVN